MTKALTLVSSVMYEFVSAIFDYLFWIVMAIVALQYRKIAKIRKEMFGVSGNTVVRDTLTATGYGIAGGLAASFLLVFTGANLTSLGI
ncbi:MAG TPA: PDZ domain-containing protein, partial [Desulfobacteria bacterium]|nr:PDZ domain-containing protein [Desulfobacteria bacterium]